jgi:peptidoglycan/xylan/chitin deacetylase (PgdA/CDA1 family)
MKLIENNDSQNQSTVAIFCNKRNDLQIIEDYFMNFWRIPYQTNPPQNGNYLVKLLYNKRLQTGLKETATLLIPSTEDAFQRWLEDEEIKVKYEHDIKIRFHATGNVIMALTLQRLYKFQSYKLTPILTFDNYPIIEQIEDQKTYLLTIDVVKEFQDNLRQNLSLTPSTLFKVFARIPFSYTIIPSYIRVRLLRNENSFSNGNKITYDNLSLDALRYLFLMALNRITKNQIPFISFWPEGKKCCLCITHDIETRQGLRNALKLMTIERKYGIRSLWNIPTERYPLNPKIIKILAENGEIGAHGTKHDGRLINLTKHRLLQRIQQCRSALTEITGAEVHGFRAPILQHSHEIIEAAAQAGYQYTSTTPVWPISNPIIKKAHGIGTVYPLILENGILEIPVTLPQDIQLIRMLGKTPEQCIQIWNQLIEIIKSLRGVCTLLIHPDYEFSKPENLKTYEKFIKTIVNDEECWITTPNELAKWWKTYEEINSRARKL